MPIELIAVLIIIGVVVLASSQQLRSMVSNMGANATNTGRTKLIGIGIVAGALALAILIGWFLSTKSISGSKWYWAAAIGVVIWYTTSRGLKWSWIGAISTASLIPLVALVITSLLPTESGRIPFENLAVPLVGSDTVREWNLDGVMDGTKERPYRPKMDVRMTVAFEADGDTYVVPHGDYKYGVDRLCTSANYARAKAVPGTNLWKLHNLYPEAGIGYVELKSSERGRCRTVDDDPTVRRAQLPE